MKNYFTGLHTTSIPTFQNRTQAGTPQRCPCVPRAQTHPGFTLTLVAVLLQALLQLYWVRFFAPPTPPSTWAASSGSTTNLGHSGLRPSCSFWIRRAASEATKKKKGSLKTSAGDLFSLSLFESVVPKSLMSSALLMSLVSFMSLMMCGSRRMPQCHTPSNRCAHDNN